MWFLLSVLVAATALLAYAGYIILIVDKRQAKQVLENPEVYEALDDKEYDFELPIEIEEYEELRESKPADKCVPATAAAAAHGPRAGGLRPQASDSQSSSASAQANSAARPAEACDGGYPPDRGAHAHPPCSTAGAAAGTGL